MAGFCCAHPGSAGHGLGVGLLCGVLVKSWLLYCAQCLHIRPQYPLSHQSPVFSPHCNIHCRHQPSPAATESSAINTGCLYKLSQINLVWGPLKCTKSNFNPVYVFLHFKSFCLVVLQLILASKLSEWEQFENFAANYQFRKKKRAKMTQKSDWCHCQAIKRCLWVGQCSPDSKIEF